MTNPFAIRVEDLSKQYRIGAPTKRGARLTEVIGDALTSPIRQVRKLFQPPPEQELIWALHNVTFDAMPGETIGIIGHNGAGKSTLLKVLARITSPTEGRAELYGRVGALLEVGTGFHSELTGRENVYLKGAILGMRRDEITRKLDDIVQFAEIGAFVDTPVKRYSSGMGMRLAFAVSAHLDVDIMIVDEVLAVGDVSFQNKCLGKMDEVTQTGRTVLFVSHNMASISRLCTRTLWMDKGQVVEDGDTKTVMENYLSANANHDGIRIFPDGFSKDGVEDFKVYAIRVKNNAGTVTGSVSIAEPFMIEIEYEVKQRIPFARIGFQILTTTGVMVFETYELDNEEYVGDIEPGRYVTRCEVPAPLLNSGYHFLNLKASIPRTRRLAYMESVLAFEVINTGVEGAYDLARHGGVVRANATWQRERIGS